MRCTRTENDLFGPIEGNIDGLEFELTEVFGSKVNNASPANTIASSKISDNDITDEDEHITLGYQILFQREISSVYHGQDLSLVKHHNIGY